MRICPDGIEAYRVTISGRRGTAPMGHVVKLNYREQVQRVIKAAIPFEDVELTFYSGEKVSYADGAVQKAEGRNFL